MGYKFHMSWEDRSVEWQRGVVEQIARERGPRLHCVTLLGGPE